VWGCDCVLTHLYPTLYVNASLCRLTRKEASLQHKLRPQDAPQRLALFISAAKEKYPSHRFTPTASFTSPPHVHTHTHIHTGTTRPSPCFSARIANICAHLLPYSTPPPLRPPPPTLPPSLPPSRPPAAAPWPTTSEPGSSNPSTMLWTHAITKWPLNYALKKTWNDGILLKPSRHTRLKDWGGWRKR